MTYAYPFHVNEIVPWDRRPLFNEKYDITLWASRTTDLFTTFEEDYSKFGEMRDFLKENRISSRQFFIYHNLLDCGNMEWNEWDGAYYPNEGVDDFPFAVLFRFDLDTDALFFRLRFSDDVQTADDDGDY